MLKGSRKILKGKMKDTLLLSYILVGLPPCVPSSFHHGEEKEFEKSVDRVSLSAYRGECVVEKVIYLPLSGGS